MKKWHMEGIIGFSGSNRQKLIVPDMRTMDLYNRLKRLDSRRELYIKQLLRYCAGLFLKYF